MSYLFAFIAVLVVSASGSPRKPDSSPETSPLSSPGSSPAASPELSPLSSPAASPELSPLSSPAASTGSSPLSSPGSSPAASPESNPFAEASLRPEPPGLVGQVGMNVVGDIGQSLYYQAFDLAERDDPTSKALGNLLKAVSKVVIFAGDDAVAGLAGNTVSALGKTLSNGDSPLGQLLQPVGKLVVSLGNDQ